MRGVCDPTSLLNTTNSGFKLKGEHDQRRSNEQSGVWRSKDWKKKVFGMEEARE
jgi:hypothetical protein